MPKSNGTYIYPNWNTEHEEHLRKTDLIAYLFKQLHDDDPDVPEEKECFSNIMKAVNRYIDPKYLDHGITTFFENALTEYRQIHDVHGFKLGVEFATQFFKAVEHPYTIDEIEAARKYEWMAEPLKSPQDDD